MNRHFLVIPAVATAALLASTPALRAQGVSMPRPDNPMGPVVQPRDDLQEKQKAPEPPSVPGSQSKRGEAAPQQTPTLDMPPTEALFDAINRGDLAAAKDALNRGADLFGRNILGMTPTELSVDLGRNDITFLLLSLRPASVGELPPASRQAAAPPATRAGRPSAPPRATVGAKSASPPPKTPASLAPRQFAGDGGTPVPQAGFLGFGSTTR
ncbi:MAG: ankyrin repeat domain-containing protein [Acetobacteraceae bacterium]|nr:ankyrin repeat domain-containing protein [Acetobacteraceae bacterium]